MSAYKNLNRAYLDIRERQIQNDKVPVAQPHFSVFIFIFNSNMCCKFTVNKGTIM